jgi:hypothetical protein
MIVALSKDFLLAFSNVQKSHQKKVREFFERFQAHPESTGLNYEPIQSVRDKNVYSVRIDQAYRAIMAKPAPNLYVLLWADHHDEAYRWAERTQLKVHPATGALQVLEIGTVTEEPTGSPRAASAQAGSLFAHVKDRHLVQLGVPEELLPAVRAMHTDADLEGTEALFPQEAYEALFMLASADDQVTERHLETGERLALCSADEGEEVGVDHGLRRSEPIPRHVGPAMRLALVLRWSYATPNFSRHLDSISTADLRRAACPLTAPERSLGAPPPRPSEGA